MAHERRRAALAALCVLAIALAATLFPASGFGTQPSGVGVSGGGVSDAPPGDVSGSDRDSTSTTDPDRPADTTTDSTTSDTSSEEQSTESTTTATTTETETEAAGNSTFGGLGGLFRTVLLTLIGLLGLSTAVGFRSGTLKVTTTAGPLPFTLSIRGVPVGKLAGRIPTTTMSLVVSVSASIPRLLDDAASLTRAVGKNAGTVLGAVGRGTGEALRIGAVGLSATVTAVPRALAGLGSGVGIFASLGNVSVPSIGRSSNRDDRGNTSRAQETAPEETGPPSIEEAWQSLRDRVPVRNRDARTPGEVARSAAERGYPDDAVRRLTDAFREVRYGNLPREERTDSARSALDRLRAHWRDDK